MKFQMLYALLSALFIYPVLPGYGQVVKTEKGKQSDKQKEFQATVENLGFDYFVVRNLDEFKQKIKNKI